MNKICQNCNCNFTSGHKERKYCSRLCGYLFRSPRREPFIADGIGNIPLTRNQIALIDAEDIPKAIGKQWYADKKGNTFYAATQHNGKLIYLHRIILGITDPNIFADHIDGNGLNDQKANLRTCSGRENSRNTRKRANTISQYKGVRYSKRYSKWTAHIDINQRESQLGSFDSEIEAARAYDAAAIKNFGEFAKLNFPKKIG